MTEGSAVKQATLQTDVEPGYRLICSFDAVGPRAQLQDASKGQQHTIEAFNRAAFLYALLERSDQSGLWVSASELGKAVWGRRATPNNLNTLVYRIRKELREAGFTSSFLEVKRGFVRLRPAARAGEEATEAVRAFNDALESFRKARSPEAMRSARSRLTTCAEQLAGMQELTVRPS